MSQLSNCSTGVRHERLPTVHESCAHKSPQVPTHHIHEGGGFESSHAHPSVEDTGLGGRGFKSSYVHPSIQGTGQGRRGFESSQVNPIGSNELNFDEYTPQDHCYARGHPGNSHAAHGAPNVGHINNNGPNTMGWVTPSSRPSSHYLSSSQSG